MSMDVAEAGDRFGFSLGAGDFDLDGRSDLVVGVPLETVRTVSAGALNVLYGSSTGLSAAGDQLWHQNRTGVPEAAESNDAFGVALTD
ncbi:MAG: FG-GAP repeat protein [Gemmatimonadetes bacterium]|nr:FG-GAP repeat protein [Gemmatimonadota bacterium]